MKLATTEEDLEFQLQAVDEQGHHLAEVQAVLAEREIQLKQARALIQKQNKAMKEMRQKAEMHIQRLQTSLKKQA